MLIKGGTIHTITGQGTIVGDILVKDGKIAAVGGQIEASEDVCILNAQGLHILPGMIDVHIHDGPEVDAELLRSPQASGVTMGLLWPDDEGTCRTITTNRIEESRIFALQPENYTDAQLHDRFISLAESGKRIACGIKSARECRRILQAIHSTRVKAILVHLSGCEDMLEAVALSGCPVIIGVSDRRTSSPWVIASRLETLGVQVAVTCSYPHAKLRHLPLCAALCARDGMDRKRALHTVTTAPAAILGHSDAGRIAISCQADFAIYDGDPLLLATSHVMTIAGGKIRH